MPLFFRKFIWKLHRSYYELRYGIKFGIADGTMLPKLGKGKFVSVYKKGSYIEIVNEKDGRMVRLIPYQPNHGVMVEAHKNGRIIWRNHCDYKTFMNMSIGEKP